MEIPAFLKLQDDGNSTISTKDIIYYGKENSSDLRIKWFNDNRLTSVMFSYYHSRLNEEDIKRLDQIFLPVTKNGGGL